MIDLSGAYVATFNMKGQLPPELILSKWKYLFVHLQTTGDALRAIFVNSATMKSCNNNRKHNLNHAYIYEKGHLKLLEHFVFNYIVIKIVIFIKKKTKCMNACKFDEVRFKSHVWFAIFSTVPISTYTIVNTESLIFFLSQFLDNNKIHA